MRKIILLMLALVLLAVNVFAVPSINLTIDTPQNNSIIDLIDLENWYHNVWINITHNETGNVGCYLNDSSWTKESSYNITFQANANSDDGVNINNLAQCDDDIWSSTCAPSSGDYGWYYANYTMQSLVTSTFWMMDANAGDCQFGLAHNVSINGSCIHSKNLQLKIGMANNVGGLFKFNVSCFNESNEWQMIQDCTGGPGILLNEVDIWYNKTIQNFNNNTNLPDQNYNILSYCNKTYTNGSKILNGTALHNFTINTTRAIDNCTSYQTESFNATFIDLDSGEAANVNVSLSVEGEENYYDDFFDVNTFSLCIYPALENFTETITIQYTIDGVTSYYNLDTYLINYTQNVTIYVQDGEETVTFLLKDQDTKAFLDDVLGTMYRQIGGSYIPIQSKYSDISGRIQFTYQENVKYRFFFSHVDYEDYVFFLDPVLFSTYDLWFDRSISVNDTPDYGRIALTYYPQRFNDGQENNFTFLISSPYDELNSYGYTLTYPGGSVTNSGSTAAGEELTNNFTITGAEFGDTIKFDYYYNTNVAGQRNFTQYFEILVDSGNHTMINIQDHTYGMGLFERLLIASFIVLLIVGIASLIGQIVPGLALGLIVYGYLAYILFIPIWSVLISIGIGLSIIGSRSGG